MARRGARSALTTALLTAALLVPAPVGAQEPSPPPDGLTLEVVFYAGGSCEGERVTEVDGSEIHTACAVVVNGSGEAVEMRSAIGLTTYRRTGSVSSPLHGMVSLPGPLPIGPGATDEVHLSSGVGRPVEIPPGCEAETVSSEWEVTASWGGQTQGSPPEVFDISVTGTLTILGEAPVCPTASSTSTTTSTTASAPSTTTAVRATATPRFTG